MACQFRFNTSTVDLHKTLLIFDVLASAFAQKLRQTGRCLFFVDGRLDSPPGVCSSRMVFSCKRKPMKPYVICHMCTTIDGKILGDRWGRLPGHKDSATLFETTAASFGIGAWLVGTTTMDEFDGPKTKLPRARTRLVRRDHIANPKAKRLAIGTDTKACYASRRAKSTEITSCCSSPIGSVTIIWRTFRKLACLTSCAAEGKSPYPPRFANSPAERLKRDLSRLAAGAGLAPT